MGDWRYSLIHLTPGEPKVTACVILFIGVIILQFIPSKHKAWLFITFVQRRPNVFDVGPTLYKCYKKFCVYWVIVYITANKLFVSWFIYLYFTSGNVRLQNVRYNVRYNQGGWLPWYNPEFGQAYLYLCQPFIPVGGVRHASGPALLSARHRHPNRPPRKTLVMPRLPFSCRSISPWNLPQRLWMMMKKLSAHNTRLFREHVPRPLTHSSPQISAYL